MADSLKPLAGALRGHHVYAARVELTETARAIMIIDLSGKKAVVLNIDEVSERVTEVENTAWTYDADYEYLADDSLAQIAVGGIRCAVHPLHL